MRFADRRDAGRRLGARLSRQAGAFAQSGPEPAVVVLGLPRGGVPVGFEVARALGAVLDVVMVRKLGVPGRPELAMGALGEGGLVVRNADVIDDLGVRAAEFDAVLEHEHAELDRRVRRYRRGTDAVAVAGRTVVLVDDGIATGATIQVACRVVRGRRPEQVVVAAPVAAVAAVEGLRADADSLIVLHTPRVFAGVGQFYRDFAQTTDAEVVDLLRRAGSPQ